MTTITTLPTPPSRADSTNFSTRGDAFLGALPTFVTEANAVGSEATAAAAAAAASASAAAASQSTASTAAAAVAAQSPVANAAAAAASAAAAAASAAAAAQTSGAVAATTLSASGAVSGAGFSTYLASPPAIGGTAAAAMSATSLTDSGNLNFTGTGNRITGDFSNATVASRIMFQSSTTNGRTVISAIPNGTGTGGTFAAYGSSDPANSASLTMYVDTSANTTHIASGITGTGTYLPMTFYTGGSERVRADTSGNVGIGTASPSTKLDVSGLIRSSGYSISGTGVTGGTTVFSAGTISTDANWGMYFRAPTGSSALAEYSFRNAADTERLRIDGSGNVTLSTPTLLGYGTGSGGTVTQATSKSTGVTLNKPTGVITSAADALAAGAQIQFVLSNSLINTSDVVNVGIGTSGAATYQTWVSYTASGTVYIVIKNTSAGSLSEAVKINFAIIKGAT